MGTGVINELIPLRQHMRDAVNGRQTWVVLGGNDAGPALAALWLAVLLKLAGDGHPDIPAGVACGTVEYRPLNVRRETTVAWFTAPKALVSAAFLNAAMVVTGCVPDGVTDDRDIVVIGRGDPVPIMAFVLEISREPSVN